MSGVNSSIIKGLFFSLDKNRGSFRALFLGNIRYSGIFFQPNRSKAPYSGIFFKSEALKIARGAKLHKSASSRQSRE
jgi:hypothetical protein